MVRINAHLDDLEENGQACLAETNAGSISTRLCCPISISGFLTSKWRDGGYRKLRPSTMCSARDSMVEAALAKA